MAKIKLPSYLTELNGRIDDAVFYKSGSKIFMRRYVVPANPRTEAQQKNRSLFAEAMAAWKALSPEERYKYKQKCRKLNMHPHNLFMKEYMKSAAAPAGIRINRSADLLNGKAVAVPSTHQCLSEATPLRVKDNSCKAPVTFIYRPG